MRIGLERLIDPRLLTSAAESQTFYKDRVAGHGPRSRAELSAMRARVVAPVVSVPAAEEEVVTFGDRSVTVRIHLPRDRPVEGVLLELHGGGFYMGSAAGSDVRNRLLADTLAVAVLSVDYRLAPEHPWPAAPDDCETAALWLAAHAADRFATTRLAIGGFSAGATLAMTTLLRLRDRGITAFGSAVLQFGTYDLSTLTPAGRLIADEYFLNAYVGAEPNRTLPDISPVYADLSGLPPVLIVVGTDDLLLRDNLTLAAQLLAAGVDVDFRLYPASPHGFTHHATPMGQAALNDIDNWLADRLNLAQHRRTGSDGSSAPPPTTSSATAALASCSAQGHGVGPAS